MMKWIGVPGLLLAVGCTGAAGLRLERVSLVQEKDVRIDKAFVVEIAADRSLAELQGPYVVNLRYNVDRRPPVRTGSYTYDPARIVDRLPFGAVQLEAVAGQDPRITRWAVALSSSQDRDGTVFAYDLGDAREHVLTVQVHGFTFPDGPDWTSNPLELHLPGRGR